MWVRLPLVAPKLIMKNFKFIVIILILIITACGPESPVTKNESDTIKEYSIIFDDMGLAKLSADLDGKIIYIEDEIHKVACWIYNVTESHAGGGISCIPYSQLPR